MSVRIIGFRWLLAIAAASLTTLVMAAAGAHAQQMGGSILYVDSEAATQKLEFRAHAWHVRGNYFRAVVDYREAGSVAWKDLDENWGWTRQQALAEITQSARYLARDGHIWRFANPIAPPQKAIPLRFDETCWQRSQAGCVKRLKTAWDRRHSPR